MIDETSVLTAKFWEALRATQHRSGMREADYEIFSILVIGLECAIDINSRWGNAERYRADLAFNGLEQVVSKPGVQDFRRAWIQVHDALFPDVDSYSSEQAHPLRELGSVDALLEVRSVLRSFMHDARGQSGMMVAFFDEVFHRVMSRHTGQKYRAGDAVAALAARLSSPFEEIFERFATTAEASVIRHIDLELGTRARFAAIDDVTARLIGLRLRIHGIAHPEDHTQQDSLSAPGFLLVDHPKRRATSKRPFSRSGEPLESSLACLEHLLTSRSHFRSSLFVVPGIDRTAAGWRRQLREHIVRSGLLTAVIDLPGRNAAERNATAWLLSSRPPDREVLMIDARSMIGRADFLDESSLMTFVSAIVSIGAPSETIPMSLTERVPISTDVKALFDANFADGYHDLEGVCRLVSGTEISNNGYKLVASQYLAPPQEHRRSLSLLNSEPIVSALEQGIGQGIRIYIIGNNGEGKSILLRELSAQLVSAGRRVFGVAFGPTDRFQFDSSRQADQLFVYLGARTSHSGIANARTSSEVFRMARDVHTDEKRLHAFNLIVGNLGFAERRYLVPTNLKDRLFEDKARHAELLSLSESPNENFDVFHGARSGSFSLGFMRQESGGSITKFDELSSGEQQLILLALKLTAHAATGSVILVDEPELSLHVSWQRAIPAILEKVSDLLGSSFVVATHSPVVVSSAHHPDDKCFVAHRHTLTELTHPRRSSVETALFDGFLTYTANNRQVHERCATVVSQAIQRLNDPTNLRKDRSVVLDDLRKELDAMDWVIRLAEPAQLEHAGEDRELVSRARAVLDELNLVRQGSLA